MTELIRSQPRLGVQRPVILVWEQSRIWLSQLRSEPAAVDLEIRPILNLTTGLNGATNSQTTIIVVEITSGVLRNCLQDCVEASKRYKLFAVGQHGLRDIAVELRQLGFTSVFPGLLQTVRLLRLARRYFSTHAGSDCEIQHESLNTQMERLMPWPAIDHHNS